MLEALCAGRQLRPEQFEHVVAVRYEVTDDPIHAIAAKGELDQAVCLAQTFGLTYRVQRFTLYNRLSVRPIK